MNNRQIMIEPNMEVFEKLGVKSIEIKNILLNTRTKRITFNCSVSCMGCIDDIDTIYKDVLSKFGREIEIEFVTENKELKLEDEEIKTIAIRAIERLKSKNTTSKSFLCFYKVYIKNNYIIIELNDEHIKFMLEEVKISSKIESILAEYGLKDYKIMFSVGDFSKEFSNVEEKIKADIEKQQNIISSEREKIIKENFVTETQVYKAKNDFKRGSKTKDIKGDVISIKDFYDLYDGEPCIVQGEIFSIENMVLKSGKTLKTIRITDGESSLTSKIFLDENDNLDISEGKILKLSGKVQMDTYAGNEKTLMINTVNIIEKEVIKKEDTAEEKMVELHTHTKMSEMVGVTDVEDLIKRAKEYGHKAITITDYSVVHSYPAAYKTAKKLSKDDDKMKVIFGCEMYMIDDEALMITNPKDKKIDEEEFVVFDIETTGLNSHTNKIIEIGAVKIKAGRIIDRYSQLINPGISIPYHITEITSITNEQVANQPKIDEVIGKFVEFIGDAVLVAHNAPFDMGFIKRDIKEYLNIDLESSVIDTLQMARDLFPDFKKYGLGDLNKALGLALEKHHRAVDDSQATANMFIIFLEKYKEKGVEYLKDINKGFEVNVKKQSLKNIMVQVKTQEGLKNMYKLVSEGHIKYFGNKKARIPKSVLKENREGLIVGSSLSAHFMNSGELVELYLRHDLEKLEETAKFYDYIELLPKSTYNELIEKEGTGSLASYEDVEKMNKYFYDLGKRLGILVTASSNVHYLDENEDIIRSILLYGSGTVYNPRQYRVNNGFYFRTTDEMLKEFSYLGEQEAKEVIITNTNKIADMVEEGIKPIPEGFYPPKMDNAEEIVRTMTYEKAYRIYGDPLPDIVSKRLERELNAIINNGFSVLYLSAQKLVKKSLDNGYLVGSRGSVGSSLVAFMMGITEVNALYPHYICDNPECKHSEFIEKEGVGIDLPDKICPNCGALLRKDGYSIPFEVFMGFKGDKVPDIDLNFSGEYQSEIHRYCEELFGKENVFKAGTISTLAEKNAEAYVRKYFEDNNLNAVRAEIIRLGRLCQGAKKTTGQHPGGMVIVPQGNSIYEFCPVQRPANDETSESTTTHYDYHVMDEQLVKLDILGHDDPTTIKLLQEYTNMEIKDIPLADKDTLKIFSSTESLGVSPEEIGTEIGTYGIPEFGTGFVRQMLIDTRPTTFAELVRISGLSHGTNVWLNNAQEFVRNGQATLSQIITVRDDIMNYLIDQGLDNSDAFKIMEFVRKGKPKKEPENWENYSNMMKEKNVPDWYIESCRRIEYMFPKGHAVAYVMMAMRIAYFKVHKPLAFYAAFLSRKADDFDMEVMSKGVLAKQKLEELSKEPKLDPKKKNEQAICEIVVELEARGIELLPVDIYLSEGKKFKIEDGKIRIPLIGISGLGGAVIENILKEREEAKFISVEDLKRRTKMSQTVADKLKSIGAISSLSETNQISLF
ncbi:PolC-type DNA polymerase III [Fusobacterium pseudoperiodonticum]|uniref:PolC-type DNA polymerase III n=1 Tax=Fusobacterium pseudoperiodonticum TaxID=2663009 RepID=UPI000C1B4D1A|nr:PolC-type DNA polymerase III [Fusobacterium pseudoperiodonticum]ATV63363.1 PolC-type DNA polymerase III [Fusobacterium pseudoperiodonticum]ATV67669.1 PolC-type DNA polymerase III [Fusobacterium pseudoperiodonticum]PIM77340.1 PolC-type DNA polymerase III [Fusobacterium pseudoperiodonticum]